MWSFLIVQLKARTPILLANGKLFTLGIPGRIVTVHSLVDKGTGRVARCCLVGGAAGLPLEIPVWMFDRLACATARFEDDPQVGITALSDLRALLTEVTAGDHLESRLP